MANTALITCTKDVTGPVAEAVLYTKTGGIS